MPRNARYIYALTKYSGIYIVDSGINHAAICIINTYSLIVSHSANRKYIAVKR